MSNTELATREPARPTTVQNFAGFDPATYHALRESIGAGAPAAEFKAHLLLCQRLGLSPVGGHVHLVAREITVKRGGQFAKETRYATQIGIDGYRSLAEDHGDYDGQDEPEYQYTQGGPWTEDVDVAVVPYAARVKVYRKSISRPIAGRAYWEQFAAMRTYEKEVQEDGKKVKRRVTEPVAMWKKMPHHMLAKCAEAQALRKAFPRILSGLYTTEELSQARGEVIEGQAAQLPGPTEAATAEPRSARPEGEKFNPADITDGSGAPGEIIDGSPAEADQVPVVEVDNEEAVRAIEEQDRAKGAPE